MLDSRALNILYIGTFPPYPGGSAISGSLIVLGLARTGHRMRAVTPITSEAFRSDGVFADSHLDVGVTRYLVPYFETTVTMPPPEGYQKQEWEQLYKIVPRFILRERPDVIIAGRETFARVVPDIAKKYSIPCVLRVVGSTTIALHNRTYPNPAGQKLLKQYQKVDLIVAPAKHMKKALEELGFKNIKVIPNGVDLDQFSPKPKNQALLHHLAIKEEDIVIVHVSNLKPVKRSLDLILSAEQALRQNPKLFYVIVGDGPLRQSMEEICRQKDILSRFAFVGWVDYDRVADYINLADIVVMPSEAEGQSRVYLETQACARLLLASDIPAARELIVHGETGLLFRMGDIKDLTAKTLLGTENPSLRNDIGHRSQQQVKIHSLEGSVAAYAEMLKEVAVNYRR